MRHDITGGVDLRHLDWSPDRDLIELTYTTALGARLVRTFELERQRRKVWEIRHQQRDTRLAAFPPTTPEGL